jgi:hypothetical protein
MSGSPPEADAPQDATDHASPVEEESVAEVDRPSHSSSALAPLSIRKRRPPSGVPPPPSDEIEAAIDLLFHGVPPEDFDPLILRFCIEKLTILKRDSIRDKNYLEADYYSQLIKQSQRAADIGTFSLQCTHKLEYFIQKQCDAQDMVDETVAGWARLFREFEETADSKLRDLTQAQNDEIDAFDRSCPDDLPEKYIKHSVEYFALRKRERLLVHNQDFVTADAVKQRADVLEAEELTAQRLRLQEDLERQRNAIIEKHSQQFNAFAGWLNTKRHDMARARARDLEGPLRRLDHYARLVEKIEKHGIPPNPTYGFTTHRVSRQESIRAIRIVAQAPAEGRPARPRQREKPPLGFRPTSAMKSAGGRTVRVFKRGNQKGTQSFGG